MPGELGSSTDKVHDELNRRRIELGILADRTFEVPARLLVEGSATDSVDGERLVAQVIACLKRHGFSVQVKH